MISKLRLNLIKNTTQKLMLISSVSRVQFTNQSGKYTYKQSEICDVHRLMGQKKSVVVRVGEKTCIRALISEGRKLFRAHCTHIFWKYSFNTECHARISLELNKQTPYGISCQMGLESTYEHRNASF